MYRGHQADVGTTVVNRRMGFGSSLVWGLSGIIVTAIVAASGISVYALRVADRRADSAVDLIAEVLQQLPQYRDALPPALADAIDDVRRPEYRSQLEVTTQLLAKSGNNIRNASVEVHNAGDQLVSLLSMRIVGLDSDGQAVDEQTTYAATPIQLDNDWRGPLLPGETRRFVVRWYKRESVASLTHEITEVRVWRGPPTGDEMSDDDGDSKGATAADTKRVRASRIRVTREVVSRANRDD